MALARILYGLLLILFSAVLVVGSNEERRTEAGVDCSPDDDIFFNMDISIEDFGGKCSSRDANIIGQVLQRVAIEIESEVRSARADLAMTVCPVPSENGGRNRRTLSREANVTVQRNLEKKIFTYKCGGQYSRCGGSGRNRKRNLDALGSSAVCDLADKATYAAEIAVAAFKDAETVYTIAKEKALQCEILRAGEKEVTLTKSALEEARKELQVVNDAEKRARQACNLADSPTVTVDERIEFVSTARTASAVAIGAAEKIRSWLFVMEDGFGPSVCGEVTNPEGISPQAVYDFVNTATFGAEMADMSYNLAQAAYLDLRQRALECRDIGMAEGLVASARTILDDMRGGKVRAKKEADNARSQLERIKNGGMSMSDLTDCVQKAKRASIAASTEAGKVHRMQLLMQDDVASGNVCSQIPKQDSTATPSVKAVCDMARKSTYGSDMATATFRAAQAAFKDLMKDALDCGELGMGESTIITAKRSVTQLKKLQKKALSRAKKAKAQCEKVKKNPSNLAKSLQMVESSSMFTMSQAKKAESLFGTIRNALDRNICQREAKARRVEPSPAAVCQAASGASFAASMAGGAADAADEIFSDLKDRVLNCYDLRHGQEFTDAASTVKDQLTASKKATIATSKQARKLCKQAHRASSTAGLKGMMERAELLSREAMRSAKSTANQYHRLRDDFIGSFCTEMKIAGPTESHASGEPANTGTGAATGPQVASMNDWMEQIARMLYSKIPHFLQREYNAAKLGSSCIVEGFNVNVLINALARIEDRAFWVTEDSC